MTQSFTSSQACSGSAALLRAIVFCKSKVQSPESTLPEACARSDKNQQCLWAQTGLSILGQRLCLRTLLHHPCPRPPRKHRRHAPPRVDLEEAPMCMAMTVRDGSNQSSVSKVRIGPGIGAHFERVWHLFKHIQSNPLCRGFFKNIYCTQMRAAGKVQQTPRTK